MSLLMTPAKEQEIKAMDITRETCGVKDYEVINIPSPPKPSDDAKLVAKIAEEMRLKFSKMNDNSQVLKAEFKPVAPTRFKDKVEWLRQLYAKREKFNQQRQQEIDLTNFQMADVDLRGLLNVKSNNEKQIELERAEALAREENAIMKEWEIINDRNLYNSKCIENIEANNLLKALEYSRLYRTLCLKEKYEDALIREKKILREMGQDFRIGAGSKEGSEKYKTPIEIHNDLFQLRIRNKNDPSATLTSPRPISPVYRNKNSTKHVRNIKPISPVKKLIIELDHKQIKAKQRIKNRRKDRKKNIEIVKRSLVSLKKNPIFLPKKKSHKLNRYGSTSLNFNPYATNMMHNILSSSRRGRGSYKNNKNNNTRNK